MSWTFPASGAVRQACRLQDCSLPVTFAACKANSKRAQQRCGRQVATTATYADQPNISEDAASSSQGSKRGRKGRRGDPKSQARNAAELAQGGQVDMKSPQNEKGPKTSGQAIEQGIERMQQKQYWGAIEMFNMALELPGSGAMRLAGTVREYRCASEGEENAALYNMACAYAQLQRQESAFTCLEAALENGLDDFQAIRSDPDLDPIRGNKLDQLLSRHDGITSIFTRKRKDDKRGWIGW